MLADDTVGREGEGALHASGRLWRVDTRLHSGFDSRRLKREAADARSPVGTTLTTLRGGTLVSRQQQFAVQGRERGAVRGLNNRPPIDADATGRAWKQRVDAQRRPGGAGAPIINSIGG